MLILPQLSTGAAVQYPIRKQFSQRSVRSVIEDGTNIVLADRGANYLRWKVSLQDLSNDEALGLQNFFAATRGKLLPFIFLDPTANLLLYSEDFTQEVWDTKGLTIEKSVADPNGTTRAIRAQNPGTTDLTIAQTTSVPGQVNACYSVYLRSSTTVSAILTRNAGNESQSIAVCVNDIWQRYYLPGNSLPTTDKSRFGLTIPSAASLEMFGPQLDAQLTPSYYVTSTGPSGGVYTNARFDLNQIDITATGPNRSACVLYIRCNIPGGD